MDSNSKVLRSPLSPNSDRKLRFGIIGLGNRAGEHIDCINRHGDACEILALCTRNEQRLNEVSEQCPGKPAIYTDYRELLTHPDLNVVLILTPNYLHAPMCTEALNAGHDVVVEKPMALNIQECERMNAAAQKSNRILMVAEQHRYMALTRKLKALIDHGEIGKLEFIWAASFREPWKRDWYSDYAMSGGVLLNEAIHDLDTFYWLAGMTPEWVTGAGGTFQTSGFDTYDHAFLTYVFQEGVKLVFGFSNATPGAPKPIMIFGSQGRLEYTRKGNKILQYTYTDGRAGQAGPVEHDLTEAMSGSEHPGTFEMYDEVIQCIRERREPLTNGIDALIPMRMAMAGQDAMRRKTPQNIDIENSK